MDGKIKIEPKIGEIITVDGIKYITQKASDGDCRKCALWESYCWNIVCDVVSRKDCTSVIFKKVKTDMNEVKIQIPENWELIKDGNKYVVKEKKQEPPRSWEEFCEKYPLKKEAFIDNYSDIKEVDLSLGKERDEVTGKNWCTSKEEAEAFLALIQLRQLRKAWIGDWEQPSSKTYIAVIAYSINYKEVVVDTGNYWSNMTLSFPTKEMAKDFFNCFRDLCEIAKFLL